MFFERSKCTVWLVNRVADNIRWRSYIMINRYWPMMKLLLARSRLSCGIRQATDGRAMKVLCEMSSLSRACSSASSSGNLLIWLWLKFSSANSATKSEFSKSRFHRSGDTFKNSRDQSEPGLATWHSPVINENFTANFGGIFVITLPERSHLFSSVCRIRW